MPDNLYKQKNSVVVQRKGHGRLVGWVGSESGSRHPSGQREAMNFPSPPLAAEISLTVSGAGLVVSQNFNSDGPISTFLIMGSELHPSLGNLRTNSRI